MQPTVMVDPEDTWFFFSSWQTGEQEASDELARGEGRNHGSANEFLAALDEN